MTQGEKKKLYDKILKLDQNDIEYIIKMLIKGKKQYLQSDQFEIDLEKTDLKILREIQNFVILRQSDKTNGARKHCQNGAIVDNNKQSDQVIKNKKVKKQ